MYGKGSDPIKMENEDLQLNRRTHWKLNRNQLKYLLIIAMLVDHIASAYVPTTRLLGQCMHVFGRLTGPGMALLLAEGYQYTRNRKKYAIRLFVFSLISWVPYSLRTFNRFPYFGLDMFGVIWTLFLAFITIWMWDKLKIHKAIKVVLVVLFCALSLFGDWSIFAVLWAHFAYINRDNEKRKWISFGIIAAVESILAMVFAGVSDGRFWLEAYQLGVVLVPIVFIFFYNGEPGSRHPFHKWFFYVFYPLHILVLYLLRFL